MTRVAVGGSAGALLTFTMYVSDAVDDMYFSKASLERRLAETGAWLNLISSTFSIDVLIVSYTVVRGSVSINHARMILLVRILYIECGMTSSDFNHWASRPSSDDF